MTIEELKEITRRLTALLDDPQPGLFSWNLCLGKVMTELVGKWTKPSEVIPEGL